MAEPARRVFRSGPSYFVVTAAKVALPAASAAIGHAGYHVRVFQDHRGVIAPGTAYTFLARSAPAAAIDAALRWVEDDGTVEFLSAGPSSVPKLSLIEITPPSRRGVLTG